VQIYKNLHKRPNYRPSNIPYRLFRGPFAARAALQKGWRMLDKAAGDDSFGLRRAKGAEWYKVHTSATLEKAVSDPF
jgi:hypothetical protein